LSTSLRDIFSVKKRSGRFGTSLKGGKICNYRRFNIGTLLLHWSYLTFILHSCTHPCGWKLKLCLIIQRAINILSLFYEDKKKCLETADKLWFGIGESSASGQNNGFLFFFISKLILLIYFKSVFAVIGLKNIVFYLKYFLVLYSKPRLSRPPARGQMFWQLAKLYENDIRILFYSGPEQPPGWAGKHCERVHGPPSSRQESEHHNEGW
jgi:hypothetical protein